MTEVASASHSTAFVERTGILWEAEGLPRIAGRLFGALLIREAPASLDELAAELAVSKSSISTEARRLESLGLLQRVSLPGDRRDYYVIAADVPLRVLEHKLAGMRRLQSGMTAALDREVLADVVRDRLAAFDAVQARITDALEALVAELRTAPATSSPAS